MSAAPDGAAAEFLAEGAFALPERGLVIYGQVRRGTVAVGQRARDVAGLEAPVAAVESVLLSATTGASAVGLVFRPRSDAELAGWQALPLAGRVLAFGAETGQAGARPAAR